MNGLIGVPQKILLYYLKRIPSPLTVSYLTTYRCNQHCKYCDWKSNVIKELDTEQAILLINQMKDCGTFKIGFSGGECLVRDDIGELLKCAKDNKIITSISTNGRNVNKHIDSIEKYVDVMQVSIDGPLEIHDKMRGAGSYSAAIEAVRAAKSCGVNVVSNTVLTKYSTKYIDFVLDLAKKEGFKILFQPVFDYKLSASDDIIGDMSPSREEIIRVMDFLIEEKKKGSPVGNSFSLLKYMKKSWPDGGLKKCLAGSLFITVTPDGRIIPCCFLESKREWPKIIDTGLKESMKNKILSEEVKKCSGCYCNAYIESTMLFSLNVEVCKNALQTVL